MTACRSVLQQVRNRVPARALAQSRDLPVAVSAASRIVATLAKSLIKGFALFEVWCRGERLAAQLVGVALGMRWVGLEAHYDEGTKPHDPLQGASRHDGFQSAP
jgi:hypothetical protein